MLLGMLAERSGSPAYGLVFPSGLVALPSTTPRERTALSEASGVGEWPRSYKQTAVCVTSVK